MPKTEYMDFNLDNPTEILTKISNIMASYGYPSRECARYTMLMEEGLIKWKKEANISKATYIFVEKNGHVRIELRAGGPKCYPFESTDDFEDYVGRIDDRLLSGTGYEINYRYRHGYNKLRLTLPKKNHEYCLFKMNVWALAVPVAIQYLFSHVISATDSILMGILDQDALAAISITGSFMSLYSILIAALVAGTTIYASQYWGNRDWASISRVFSVSLRYTMICATCFFIPSFFCPKLVMGFYTNIPEIIDLGSRYLRIVSATFILSGFCQINNGIMRNTGRVRKSTIFIFSSSVLNFVMDIILIFGLFGISPMGIEGAAAGTLIASIEYFLLSIIECVRSRNIHFYFRIKDSSVTKRLIRDYLSKSYPLVIQMITWTIADNICNSIFGHMNTDIVAANGLIDVVQSIGVFALAGLYDTCGILIGGKLGSGQLDDAKQYGKRYLKFAVYVGALTFAGVCIFNGIVEFLPFNLSSQAFYYLHILLIIEAFEIFFIGLNNTMNSGAFYAGGDTKALMIIDTVNMWLIIVPIGLLCLYVFKLPAILIAVFLHMDELTSFPFKFHRYREYKWLKKIT